MFVHTKTFHKISCKTCLVEMDIEAILIANPGKVNAQKPFNNSHKINWDKFGKNGLEFDFNVIFCREKDKVVNVKAQCDRNLGGCIRRVGWVVNTTRVDARIIGIRKKTHGAEDAADLVIPVFRTAAKSVFLRIQNSFLPAVGSPMGGQPIVISSRGSYGVKSPKAP